MFGQVQGRILNDSIGVNSPKWMIAATAGSSFPNQ